MSDSKRRRSSEWFGKADKDGFTHRSWMKNQGVPDDQFDGRPVIGICNTWSELTPCNGHFRELAEKVKRGVLEAGGFPLEFPVTSTGETLMRPTAMLFRNLVSMDVEESIRANPIDGVVLLVGCDKTTPALLMGAASCGVPTLALSGGPMLNGVLAYSCPPPPAKAKPRCPLDNKVGRARQGALGEHTLPIPHGHSGGYPVDSTHAANHSFNSSDGVGGVWEENHSGGT